MQSIQLACALAWFCLCGPLSATAADPFELADGDRVVFLGNTLLEREQRDGYWETLLTIRYPRCRIQFRNLGWSGDTVFGEARAGFGSTADGFRHLKEHVFALQPTVLFIGYGLNESFAGEAGLPRFLEGLRVLLDTLAPTKARMVLLSPMHHEDLGPPLPDPAELNKNLRLYRDALRKVAEQRGYRFVDFYDWLSDGRRASPPVPLTDNGIHLTAYGYWRAAAALERGLGLMPLRSHAVVELDRKARTHAFKITRETLPPPPAPADVPAGVSLPGDTFVLRLRGLAPGTYQLKIDARPVATATAEAWAAGVGLTEGPDRDQVEQLRQRIIEKNRLYFYRWRPQNETYLFGFRKQEQGQNAREIPLFDPLVAKQEEEIAKLRIPVAHKYELVPTSDREK
jgi:lysophospholipase L1-like esterase